MKRASPSLPAICLLLAACLPAPTLAQDSTDITEPATAPSTPADRVAAARRAEATGQMLIAVQRAAARAQLQYLGMVGGTPPARYAGAVVLPGDTPDSWDVVITARMSDAPDTDYLALAEYGVSRDTITSEVLHPDGMQPTLDGAASALAQARSFAPRAVVAAGNTSFCVADEAATGVSFVTIVLPPDAEGRFSAYVLNGPIDDSAVPLGKHFRVDFDAYGLAGEPVLLNDGCEVIPLRRDTGEAITGGYGTEFTGDVPTELHVFLTGQMQRSLTLVTPGGPWSIADGVILSLTPAD